MNASSNDSSAPSESSTPRVHPVLGSANLQCGVCLSVMHSQMIKREGETQLVCHALCSRCGVAVLAPIMQTECQVVE